MSDLFGAFGIDWRLLLINLINFGLLLFLLQRFLYKPLTQMLEKRRAMVAQGVYDAERAAQELSQIEASRAQKLADVGKEADAALAEARRSGAQLERELSAKGEAAAARLVAEAEAAAVELKAKALRESREETAKLIVLGVEKAMAESK